jgi:hypothetical protein
VGLGNPEGTSEPRPWCAACLVDWQAFLRLGRLGCDQIWGVKAQQKIGVELLLGVEYIVNAIEPTVRAGRMPVWP